MDYVFKDILLSKLKKNDTVIKYNELLAIDILESLEYEKRLNVFSWSAYCIHISTISNTPPLDIDTLYAVELIGLAARFIDDALDKDTPLFEKTSTEYLFLLSTELIVESLELLSRNNFFDYELLKAALHAEFKDFVTILPQRKLTIDFYFEEILPKSAAVFQLFTKLASHSNLYLNDFAIHYGNYTQILNDISGFWDTHSEDIRLLKSSLPLLAGVSTLNSSKNEKILHLLTSKEDLTVIREKIISTGALDFSQRLLEIEKSAAIAALNNLNPSDDLISFKHYLELE